jgi:hypothetical protein
VSARAAVTCVRRSDGVLYRGLRGQTVSLAQKGDAGQQGNIGVTGPTGPSGPGAINFTHSLTDTGQAFEVNAPNGVRIVVSCLSASAV